MDTTAEFLNSPLVVTLIGVGAIALVTLAGAAIKTVIQLAQLKTQVTAIAQDIQNMKGDPDVMRWSNYGRAVQAFQGVPPTPGSTP